MIQKTRRDGSLDGKGVVIECRRGVTSRRPNAASRLGLVKQRLTRMPRSRESRSRQKSEAGVVYPANRTTDLTPKIDRIGRSQRPELHAAISQDRNLECGSRGGYRLPGAQVTSAAQELRAHSDVPVVDV
jgi:hypothetical protein